MVAEIRCAARQCFSPDEGHGRPQQMLAQVARNAAS